MSAASPLVGPRPRSDTPQLRVLRYWIDERHAMYLRRLRGDPPPWTVDPILREYRFTNVFRRLDRMTQELLAETRRAHSHRELLFRAMLFRVFNRSATYAALRHLASPERWRRSEAMQILAARAAAGERIVTGVWMVSGAAAPGRPIYEGYVDSLTTLARFAEYDAADMRRLRTLESAYGIVQQYRGVGRFVGWQIVLDLSYTPLLRGACDLERYLYVGPGAVRGLMRLDGLEIPEGKYARLAPRYPGGEAAALARLRQVQTAVNDRRGTHVPHLTIHDVEHSLCEADKYARALRGEGRPRNTYEPRGEPLPEER